MTLIAPSYSIRAGSQEWTRQVLSIHLSLAIAPQVNAASFAIPAAAPFSAAPGDAVTMTLGSGEQEQAVFAGVIDRVRRRPGVTVIDALDGGGVLARTRPSVTFESITAGNVIRNLCAEAGIEVGDVEDGVSLAYYVADPGASAWQHVARVAAWSGAFATVSTRNRVDATVLDPRQADVALRYGREILDYAVDAHESFIDSFATAGESGVGDVSAPDALRLTSDFFAGRRPDGPGPKTSWRSLPALRTADAAASAAEARRRLYASTRTTGRLTAFLQPQLRPASLLEVRELPGDIPAQPLWVSRIEHSLSPDGALSRLEFCGGGGSFDPAGLLGSAAAALGSIV